MTLTFSFSWLLLMLRAQIPFFGASVKLPRVEKSGAVAKPWALPNREVLCDGGTVPQSSFRHLLVGTARVLYCTVRYSTVVSAKINILPIATGLAHSPPSLV